MYSDISGEFPFLIVGLVIVGALTGGLSQYLANVWNGKEGVDKWEGVIGASIGGAIALPAFAFSGATVAILAFASGTINGITNEIERSIKYSEGFSVGSALYDGIIYSTLNLTPFFKSPISSTVETMVIDTFGFKYADQFKQDVLEYIDDIIKSTHREMNDIINSIG